MTAAQRSAIYGDSPNAPAHTSEISQAQADAKQRLLAKQKQQQDANRTTTSRDQLIAGARMAGVLLAVALGEPTEEINSVFHTIQHQLARPRVG